MKNIMGILISLPLLYSCTGDEKQPVSSTNDTEKISSDKETEKELLALSEELFSLLKESNFENISELVDPEDGVTFAFYADFGNPDGYGGQYVNLSKKEISELNDTKYLWGKDEEDSNIVTFDEPAENFVGVINTIHNYYPDAKYVEYHSPGKDAYSFQSLRFIYQERDGEWYLIGLARDVATV